MILLEVNLDGLVFIIAGVMFGPAFIMAGIGAYYWKKNKWKTAKVWFILAVVYVIVSLGICGSII